MKLNLRKPPGLRNSMMTGNTSQPSVSFLTAYMLQTLMLTLTFGMLSFSLNSINSSDAKRSGVKSSGSEGSAPINNSVIPVDYKSFKTTWTEVVHINRERWRAKVPKGNVLFWKNILILFSVHL